jgi:hypothetical protein
MGTPGRPDDRLRETHRPSNPAAADVMGFTSFNPSYELALIKIETLDSSNNSI